MRVEDLVQPRAGSSDPLARLDPTPAGVVLGRELPEAPMPDLLLDGDQVTNDLAGRPLAAHGWLVRRGTCGRGEASRKARESRPNSRRVSHVAIVRCWATRCASQ